VPEADQKWQCRGRLGSGGFEPATRSLIAPALVELLDRRIALEAAEKGTLGQGLGQQLCAATLDRLGCLALERHTTRYFRESGGVNEGIRTPDLRDHNPHRRSGVFDFRCESEYTRARVLAGAHCLL
jgi:hypothetical protein